MTKLPAAGVIYLLITEPEVPTRYLVLPRRLWELSSLHGYRPA